MMFSRFFFAFALALSAASSLAAPPTAAQRQQFLLAHQAASKAPGDAWRPLARGLEDYPLHAYLEYAALDRRLASAPAAAVRDFLKRNAGTVLAERMRGEWLAHLASAGRWREYLDFHEPADSLERRCGHASARAALGVATALEADARALWSTPRSLPRSCDPMLGWLRRQPFFDAKLVWERIELAAAAREHGLVRQLAPLLGPQRAEGERWAGAIADPSVALGKASTWPADARHRQLALLATTQLARRDAARAALLWPTLAARFSFTDAERAQALNAIALYKAASYAPDAARWIAQVPAAQRDDELREWAVREAVARRDWKAALDALDVLSGKQRDDARWRYIRARALELSGDTAQADVLHAVLAREPTYHGLLAAERLGLPYAFCDEKPVVSPADAAAVERDPSFVRAFELHALGWLIDARREWTFALRDAGAAKRRAAVVAAHARGWIERGPLTLLNPDEYRLYALRFPFAHDAEIRAAATQHRIDPALVLALIRSESAWMTDARSGADAHGLMQLIPAAAKQIAQREKLPYRSVQDLYDPKLNVVLGTHHLADDLARYGGKVWLAAAAYNAGPTPVRRWMAARGALPPDLFVETIPYRETREYVARVIAFSVIYDWRLHGDAGSLANRIAVASKRPGRRPVACPTPPGTSP